MKKRHKIQFRISDEHLKMLEGDNCSYLSEALARRLEMSKLDRALQMILCKLYEG